MHQSLCANLENDNKRVKMKKLKVQDETIFFQRRYLLKSFLPPLLALCSLYVTKYI